MRNKFSNIVLAAGISLALVFTFGCSSDDWGGGSGNGNLSSGSNNGYSNSSSSVVGTSSGGGNFSGESSSSGNSSLSSSSNDGDNHSSSSSTGISSSSLSLGQSSSVVLHECDAIFNPDNKFCYDGNVYDKCDSMEYNPTTHICQNKVATPAKCGNDGYNPLTQNCCNNSTIFSITTQRCNGNIVQDKCGNTWYNQATQFCYRGNSYALCGGESYNPLTQGCLAGEVEEKCGSSLYNQATQGCCGSSVYSQATQFCKDNGVYNKCNESYNILTQYCSDGTVKDYGYITDDRDGKEYKTVVIGTQTWMAENLNYDTTYSNNTTYGRLYKWAMAMALPTRPTDCNNSTCASQIGTKHQGICPSGWHIPNDAEWTTLTNFVGTNAGTKLKATSGWNKSGNGTDDYGFAALPSSVPTFNNDGGYDYGFWWSSSELANDQANYMGIAYFYGPGGYTNKSNYFSVRCLKD